MRPVFKLNGNNWLWILNENSIHWSRNDLDSENTGRSELTGEMARKRITSDPKRKLTIDNIKRLTTSELAALNAEMNREFFTCTIIDGITGAERTMTCYNSTVEAATQVWDELTDELYWDDITFPIIEK